MRIRRRHRRKLTLGILVASVCVLLWMAIGRSQAPLADLPAPAPRLTVEEVLADSLSADQQPDSASASTTEARADNGGTADSTRIPSASVASDLAFPPLGSTDVDEERQPSTGDAAGGSSDDAKRSAGPLAGSVQPSWGGGGHFNTGIPPSFGGGGGLGLSASNSQGNASATSADAPVDVLSDTGSEAWASPEALDRELTLAELTANPRALSAELFNQSAGSPPGSSHGPPSFSNAGGTPSLSNAGGTPSLSNAGGPPSFSNAGGPPSFSNAGGTPSTGGGPGSGNSGLNSGVGGDPLIPPNEVTNLTLTDASVPVIPDAVNLNTSGPVQEPIANPEPASLLLLGSGLVLAARRLRRGRRDRQISV
jgi:hypothetical protein